MVYKDRFGMSKVMSLALKVAVPLHCYSVVYKVLSALSMLLLPGAHKIAKSLKPSLVQCENVGERAT